MAPRGVGAMMVITALIMAMTVMSGIGYYADLGADIDDDSYNEDVQNAAEELNQTSFGEDRSSSILEGPLAAVTPIIGMLSTLATVITNTSGVLQLLFGAPKVVGDTIEVLSRIAFVITFAYAIRAGASA
jgi:hypothetical protein